MHDNHHDKDLSLDELKAYFYTKYPDSDKIIYDSIFKTLSELNISEDVGSTIIASIRKRKTLLELSETAFRVSQGHEELEALAPLYEALNAIPTTDPEFVLQSVSNDLSELISKIYQQQGLRWRLQCLNKSLGSLREGDFGFIFARPETGKTTLLASEVANFLYQTDKPIIWFNNEEQGSKVMLRIYQAFFGVTIDVLLSNINRYRDEFLAITGNRFYLFDSARISKRDVESIIKKLNPGLVIYDQIDKIKGFQNDREDLRLGSIYQFAREIAKGNHAAIGVCQADGHAEGVRYLTMEHVSSAKTSKQAEADFIIGIGKTHDSAEEYVRYLNISKNKLLGDKDSDSRLRHGKFECMIKPDVARYEDVMRYD